MNKVNLFIPIEIKKRDFASRSLVGFAASLKGFNVYIGRKFEIDKLVFKKNPGIYLGLVTTKTYAPFYKKLKDYGHFIFVNDEEGLVTFSDNMYLNLKVSEESIRLIDKVFLWSESHKKTFEKRFDFKSKYIVSGSPRFDLSKKKFIKVFDDEINIIKKKYDNYILVCCSFSFANYYLKKVDYVEVLKRQKVIRNPKDLEKFKKYLHYNKEALKHFLDAIIILAKKFPNFSIIVRPHPSENKDIYINLSKKIKNVHVEEDFSIHSWIINSKCIIHNYCTSSSEALSLNIPRFALRKNFDINVHKTIPYEISSISENIDTLINKINNLIVKNNYEIKTEDAKKNFKKYLYNIDEEIYANKIIVDSLIKFLNNNSFKKKYLYYILIQSSFLLKKIIKKLFMMNKNPTNDYINHKVNKISYLEILRLFNIFLLSEKNLNIKNFEFREFSKNIVNIIYNKN